MITRPNIINFDEVLNGFREYSTVINKARTEGRNLHVVVDLTRVNRIDSKLLSYINQMKAHVAAMPDLPSPVKQVTIRVPHLILKPIVKLILPLCVDTRKTQITVTA